MLKSSALIGYCKPRNHQRNSVLRLMLKLSEHICYCWLRNRWRKLSRCRPRNHQRNPVLRLTLKSSVPMGYYWFRNRWWKSSCYRPKNCQRNPVLRLTLKSSERSKSLSIQKSSVTIWVNSSFAFLLKLCIRFMLCFSPLYHFIVVTWTNIDHKHFQILSQGHQQCTTKSQHAYCF
jgi:hypothetical protein